MNGMHDIPNTEHQFSLHIYRPRSPSGHGGAEPELVPSFPWHEGCVSYINSTSVRKGFGKKCLLVTSEKNRSPQKPASQTQDFCAKHSTGAH